MIVTSTEMQNNFGKYLMLAAQEDIVVTRNGMAIAKLSAVGEALPVPSAKPDTVYESLESYSYGGRKATYEEFAQLTRDGETRYEYIDGEIYLQASPRTAHQYALTELFGLFFNWSRGKNCRPFAAPYDITLSRRAENINVVQPDLMMICDLEDHLNEKDYYMGVPALVVEIISESSKSMDMLKKFDLYMSCGVREYWIVNPLNREITIYLFEDRNISKNITYRHNEIAVSFDFAGLSAPLESIFK
jgi:Uma2 family endonuclease